MRLSVRPQPSFADLELQRQGLAMDATLQAIGHVLDAAGRVGRAGPPGLGAGLAPAPPPGAMASPPSRRCAPTC